jgi:hypothetical protein
LAVVIAAALASVRSAEGSVEVNYIGPSGLSAKAVFDLVDADTISIVLTNNSSSPFGGVGVNGDANMVLSSINFETGLPEITGGSVVLNGTSAVVNRSGSAWVNAVGAFTLNNEYGYSNDGVGNLLGDATYVSPSLTASMISTLLQGAVTSHTNGASNVTSFNGSPGPLPGGLDFGLVAAGSTAFGNNKFILDSIKITLNFDAVIPNLDFLEDNGSYVEFGSNYAYVIGTITEVPPPVGLEAPEATSVLMWVGLAGVFGYGARKKLRVA